MSKFEQHLADHLVADAAATLAAMAIEAAGAGAKAWLLEAIRPLVNEADRPVEALRAEIPPLEARIRANQATVLQAAGATLDSVQARALGEREHRLAGDERTLAEKRDALAAAEERAGRFRALQTHIEKYEHPPHAAARRVVLDILD